MKKLLKTIGLASVLLLAVLLLVPAPKARQTTGPTASVALLQKAGIKAVGSQPPDAAQTQELEAVFGATVAAASSIPPGPDAGAMRRAIDNELRAELETFVTNNPASAWTPSVHLLLARRAQLRCGYSLALDHYQMAFESVAGSTDPVALSLARDASGGLARLLALTGRVADFDALAAQVAQLGIERLGSDWVWAQEMRECVGKHPAESYKCGLYCLDQLGRLTQPGQFLPKNITEHPSSTNGFTAADLLTVGERPACGCTPHS